MLGLLSVDVRWRFRKLPVVKFDRRQVSGNAVFRPDAQLPRADDPPTIRKHRTIARDTAKWFGAEPSLNALRPHTGHLPPSYLIDDPAAQERQRRSWRYTFRHSQSLRLSIITRSDAWTQTMSSCWKPIAVKRCGVA